MDNRRLAGGGSEVLGRRQRRPDSGDVAGGGRVRVGRYPCLPACTDPDSAAKLFTMCFLRSSLLAVNLLAAIAGGAPLDLLDVPVRAAHRVRVTVPDLHWAALEGDVAEVKRLIAAGADLNATETVYGGERPLHWAVHGGSGVVRALIVAGANLEARNDQGQTALHEALLVNDDANSAALLALLVAGADVTAQRSNGTTALHMAVGVDYPHGDREIFLLRSFGADPNAATASWEIGDSTITGITPLHIAALRPLNRFWGRALMAASADPDERELQLNAKDSLGQTPLHWFVRYVDQAQDLGLLGWLLLNGVDVSAVDNRGASPLDYAVANGDFESANLLRANGAEHRFNGGMGGGGAVILPAPPPAPPPFWPQPVEVALGEDGGIYVLTLADGTLSAALVTEP